jgi:hypothetical protein
MAHVRKFLWAFIHTIWSPTTWICLNSTSDAAIEVDAAGWAPLFFIDGDLMSRSWLFLMSLDEDPINLTVWHDDVPLLQLPLLPCKISCPSSSQYYFHSTKTSRSNGALLGWSSSCCNITQFLHRSIANVSKSENHFLCRLSSYWSSCSQSINSWILVHFSWLEFLTSNFPMASGQVSSFHIYACLYCLPLLDLYLCHFNSLKCSKLDIYSGQIWQLNIKYTRSNRTIKQNAKT